MSKDNTLDLLLALEPPQSQTAEYKIKRLSRLCGRDVVFTLKQLSYSAVDRLRQMERESDIHIVLAGVAQPDLRSPELMQPGEIEDLQRAIERLCGYRQLTIEQIKKN